HGDLNGDGVDDFIVGAPEHDSAYVFSGATGARIWSLSGPAGSQFGTSVSAGGLIDSDGINDFLVRAPPYVDPVRKCESGRLSAFSGKPGTSLWNVQGNTGSWFGLAVDDVLDLDGDGRSDCIVGAPLDVDASAARTGSVTVLSGMSGTPLFTL